MFISVMTTAKVYVTMLSHVQMPIVTEDTELNILQLFE